MDQLIQDNSKENAIARSQLESAQKSSELDTRRKVSPEQAKIPEILAPAGGPSQFLAALNAGADAVFLGLKQFNARARAENFSIEELEQYVPLAHKYGMKVLVTLNIIIKDHELEEVIKVLSELARIEIDGVIVQDLGIVRLMRECFSSLKIHASTQMAVHNLHGVRLAKKLGVKRVVLARELTAQEMRHIRLGVKDLAVELETFCHGSLCYSYSGLCFFSGQDDARSGNRGECAYTCRKPYKIKNEPGRGFLFSMKDLETLDSLQSMVNAGIDTLKIEGRKKDAQFVSTVVKTYREKLSEIAGLNTLRDIAPPLAKQSWPRVREDMAFSFHRDLTSFFLEGRYHENVIDLNNPTHKGALVGEVLKVNGSWITVKSNLDLEKFDGLRIDPKEEIYHAKPQHGENLDKDTAIVKDGSLQKKYQGETLQFSLRNLMVSGARSPSSRAKQTVMIEIPMGANPKVGDLVYKTRSSALKARVERLTHAPDRLRKLIPVTAHVICSVQSPNSIETPKIDRQHFYSDAADCQIQPDSDASEELKIDVQVFKAGEMIHSESVLLPAIRPEKKSSLPLTDLIESELRIFGDVGIEISDFAFKGDFDWYVPKKTVRSLKSKLALTVEKALFDWQCRIEQNAKASLSLLKDLRPTTTSAQKLNIKIDRLEYLEDLALVLNDPSFRDAIKVHELMFEPKRAFLGKRKPEDVWQSLIGFCQTHKLALRFALPTVIRGWDEPLLKRWLAAALKSGVSRFEVGNLGAFEMLRHVSDEVKNEVVQSINEYCVDQEVTAEMMAVMPIGDFDISADFTLYVINHLALRELSSLGISRYALSVENDREAISGQLLRSTDMAVDAELIVYKDTPLFLAESCSLTALHNGCPSSAVCGYRTLEIENDEGEEFLVVHENCKSVVIGKNAFSISEDRLWSASQGIKFLRVDFLSRPYTRQEIAEVLRGVAKGVKLPKTHSGNHYRTLL